MDPQISSMNAQELLSARCSIPNKSWIRTSPSFRPHSHDVTDLLSISIWTVHNHLKNIYEKLGVQNRTEAVMEYLQK